MFRRFLNIVFLSLIANSITKLKLRRGSSHTLNFEIDLLIFPIDDIKTIRLAKIQEFYDYFEKKTSKLPMTLGKITLTLLILVRSHCNFPYNFDIELTYLLK